MIYLFLNEKKKKKNGDLWKLLKISMKYSKMLTVSKV